MQKNLKLSLLFISMLIFTITGCGSGANKSENITDTNNSTDKTTYADKLTEETPSDKVDEEKAKEDDKQKEEPKKVIVDATAPVIAIIGDKTITLTEGENYTDAGASATDDTDNKVEVTVKSNDVNTKVAGTYHVVYTARDKAGNIAEDLVRTVIINKKPNTKPVALDQNVTLDEDTNKAITLVGNDIDTDKLTYIIVTQPTHGTLSGNEATLTYMPDVDYYGVDSFTFKVNDANIDSNVATVNITVDDLAEPAYQCPANTQSEATFEDAFITTSQEDRDFNATATDVITVEIIATEFNIARQTDPTIDKLLVMPSQVIWDAYSDSEKALYLVNSERCARGIRVFEGIETSLITAPAQKYADYLKDNNAWGHEEDGRTPWERLEEDANVQIGTNADFFKYGENLASIAYGSTGDYLSVSEPVAVSVYGWLYNDKKDTAGGYGHRKFLLATGLKENFGINNKEGLIGVGVSTTQYEENGFKWTKVYTVLNAFDPNEKWENGPNIIKVDIEPAK